MSETAVLILTCYSVFITVAFPWVLYICKKRTVAIEKKYNEAVDMYSDLASRHMDLAIEYSNLLSDHDDAKVL